MPGRKLTRQDLRNAAEQFNLYSAVDRLQLSRDCAADKVYEFMFVAPAIPITGAVGAPTNPLAIK